MPSKEREGLPKAVIEAMSLGVATIVTDVGGMPEIVEHMKSGLVVKASDASALASAISRLVNDPELRMRLAKNAQERIRTSFSIETTIQQTIGVYRALVG